MFGALYVYISGLLSKSHVEYSKDFLLDFTTLETYQEGDLGIFLFLSLAFYGILVGHSKKLKNEINKNE